MIVFIRIQDVFTPLPLPVILIVSEMDLNLLGFELFRTGSCSFELVAGGLGGCGYFWGGGCGWFQVISGGFRWFRAVCCFSTYAINFHFHPGLISSIINMN